MKTNILTLIFCLFVFKGFSARSSQDTVSQVKDTINLKEVVVTEDLIKHEAGKTIVNVVTLRRGKTNLLELLQQVPGLIVDDSSIRILGKGGIMVMINGRLRNIPQGEIYGMLKSRSASNVVRVEIVKDPGAKYDASGNYGILNIITERQINHIGGDVGEGLTYKEKWGNSLRSDINYSYKKVDVNVNAGWDIRKNQYTERNTSYFTDLTRPLSTVSRSKDNNYNLSGAFDYNIDSLSSSGIYLAYSETYRKDIAVSDFYSYDLFQRNIESGSSTSSTKIPRKNLNASFYVDRKWSPDRCIEIMVDIFRYSYKNKYNYSSVMTDGNDDVNQDYFRNKGESRLTGFMYTVGFKSIIPLGIKLSYGIKGTLTTTNNSTLYDISTLPFQNDRFKYTEKIHAAYIVLQRELEKWNFEIGGRYEWTRTQADGIEKHKDNYSRLFPNILLSYSLNNGSDIEIAINSGIDRPGIRHINSFSFYSNNYNVSKGNPEIKPSHWWNAKLTENWVFPGGELTMDLIYLREYKLFDQTTSMDNTGSITTIQWNNAYDNQWKGFDASLYYYKLRWLKVIAIVELGYNKNTPLLNILPDKSSYFNQYYMTNLIFKLNKSNTLTATINSSYKGKEKTVVGTINGIFNFGCGIDCVLKKKINFRFAVNNIFASDISGTNNSNDSMHMDFRNSYNPISVTLNVSYNFGSEINIKSKNHISKDIEERF